MSDEAGALKPVVAVGDVRADVSAALAQLIAGGRSVKAADNLFARRRTSAVECTSRVVDRIRRRGVDTRIELIATAADHGQQRKKRSQPQRDFSVSQILVAAKMSPAP